MALKIIPHVAMALVTKNIPVRGNVLPLSLEHRPLEAAHTNTLQLAVMHSLRKD